MVSDMMLAPIVAAAVIAVPVPRHVVDPRQPTAAVEAGDIVEVRLPAGDAAWRRAPLPGIVKALPPVEGTVRGTGTTAYRAFRFQLRASGTARLRFTAGGAQPAEIIYRIDAR